MMFNKFRRQSDDKLNMAHSLGLGAIGFLDELATDLDVASDLAGEHSNETAEAAKELLLESESAERASVRYSAAAQNIRGLVPAA